MTASETPSLRHPQAPPECDIVMKGGITSGVVYPKAITEIARSYRYRRIGGASAGAVAAALAAAAEYRRQTDQTEAGFQALEHLADWLGQDGHLLGLFQPQPEVRAEHGATYPQGTGRLFHGLMGAMEGQNRQAGQDTGRKNRSAVMLAALAYLRQDSKLRLLARLAARLSDPASPAPLTGWVRLAVLLAAALLVLLLLAFALGSAGLLWLGAAALALNLGLVGWGLWTAYRLGRRLAANLRADLGALAANRYGLCSGHSTPGQPEALTGWLERQLREVAGLDGSAPLTFGHLRAAGIELRLMTTCLSLERPYRLPFAEWVEGSDMFYFKPAEFRDFFPAAVVEQMQRAAEADPKLRGCVLNGGEYYPFPREAGLPVVVAARLSLSFPFLFSALPLYTPFELDAAAQTATEHRPPDQNAGDFDCQQVPDLRRVWFSDGGICSNFPLFLFDEPVSSRPVFAINLQYRHTLPEQPVWMPPDLNTHWRPWLNEISGLLPFIGSVYESSRNWSDNALISLPGYEDRIAHVTLSPSEGGLNLRMPPSVIGKLTERGGLAGQTLVRRFTQGTQGPDGTWTRWADVQHWTRYRTALLSLEQTLLAFEGTYGTPAFQALLNHPPYAALSPAQLGVLNQVMQHVCQAVHTIQLAQGTPADPLFQAGTPRPLMLLRYRPRL